MGDSEHSEYVPFIMSGFTNRMSLMERTINTALVHLTTKIPKMFNTPVFEKLVQHYLPGCPPLLEIEHNTSLIFTNTHPSISYPRASPPSLIEIGAIHCHPAKPLPTVSHYKYFIIAIEINDIVDKQYFLYDVVGSLNIFLCNFVTLALGS